MSILAFVLDHLLPASYTQGNSASQVAKLAKTFLQCLASTDLPTDALTIFANEFRSAFSRSLVLPESQFKHYRVRALAGLLGQIVEPSGGTTSRSLANPSQFVRMLIRKGFITDLSKALYSLDLSSPMLALTVNTLLKPLESLTKIVTQFLAAQKRASAFKGSKRGEQSNTTDGARQSTTGQEQGREDPGHSEATSSSENQTTESTTQQMDQNTQTASSSATEHHQESLLGAADESLIPLQGGADGEEDGEHGQELASQHLLQEAVNVALELGRRMRREGEAMDSLEDEDGMDIDVSYDQVTLV